MTPSPDISTDASYWQARHGVAPTVQAPTLPASADYVIVGGGLAGISTARSILAARPDASVVVLESAFVGYGASGRNGGLLSPLPAPVWLLTAGSGNDTAWALKTLNTRVHALGRRLQAHTQPAEACETQLQLHAMGRVMDAGLAQVARVLEVAGIAHDVRRDPERAGRRTLALPTYAVDPYALVRALADKARAEGALICEQAPVAAIIQIGAGARITLQDGRALDTRCAVVCTNAYTGTLGLPQGARKAKAVRNYMLATDVLSPELQARLGEGRRYVVELDKSYVFYRLHQGRLVYGGIESFSQTPGSDFAVPAKIRDGLAKLVRRSLGTDCPPIARAWSGRYHATLTETPIIGRHPKAPAIVMNVGYGGTGVALTQIFSDLAGSIATGRAIADPDAARLGHILQETRLPVRGLVAFGASVARQLLLGGGAAAGLSQAH